MRMHDFCTAAGKLDVSTANCHATTNSRTSHGMFVRTLQKPPPMDPVPAQSDVLVAKALSMFRQNKRYPPIEGIASSGPIGPRVPCELQMGTSTSQPAVLSYHTLHYVTLFPHPHEGRPRAQLAA